MTNVENSVKELQNKVWEWDTMWGDISAENFGPLSEDFMREHADQLDWRLVSQNPLREEFMIEMQDYLYWYNISRSQQLSESFMERFSDKLNWEEISRHQKLSEPFIEKYKNRIYWIWIAENQTLSFDFIMKHMFQIGYFTGKMRKNKNIKLKKEQWKEIMEKKNSWGLK